MKCASISVAVFSLLIGAVLPAAPATAQMLCGKRDDFVRQLGEKYGETRRSIGLAQGSGVMEVFASDETGSWTIIITNPQGTACLMAAGEAFQLEPVKAADKPA